jgi:cytochrome c oxidase subunit 4
MTDGHTNLHKHTGLYLGIFALLVVGTIATVGASRVDLSHGLSVVVALLIAGVKASLVAAVFMHLKWEKAPALWLTLVLCGIFFAALLLLPMLAVQDLPPQVKIGTWG